MTNSRLLVKLNKYAKQGGADKEPSTRKSFTKDKRDHNLEITEQPKSTRKSLEPCYNRSSKTGRLRDQ